MVDHSYSSNRKIKFESTCRDVFQESKINQLRRRPEIRDGKASYPFKIHNQSSLVSFGGN